LDLQRFKKTSEITIETLDLLKKEARRLRYYKCDCECHRCNILNMWKHNAISVISKIQCLECPCPPIQFNADEFDIIRLHLRTAWRNKIQRPFPIWLKNEKMLLDLLVKMVLKEESQLALPKSERVTE